MTHALSILQKAIGSVIDAPFPYVVTRNVIDQEVYDRLAKARTRIDEIIIGEREPGDNERRDLSTRTLNNMNLPSVWSRFIQYHTSQAFWWEICKVFGGHVRTLYPHLELDIGELEKFRVGVRGVTGSEDADIFLDCQIGLNTPRLKKARVRGPHIDNAKELFAAMYYMKPCDDESEGGHLQVFEPLDWQRQLMFHGKAELHDHQVKEVDRVLYSANTVLAWVNCPYAIHGVTARPIGAPPRLLVNVIAELNQRLFRTHRDHT